MDYKLNGKTSAMAALTGDILVINKCLDDVDNRQERPGLTNTTIARPMATADVIFHCVSDIVTIKILDHKQMAYIGL